MIDERYRLNENAGNRFLFLQCERNANKKKIMLLMRNIFVCKVVSHNCLQSLGGENKEL